MKRKMDKTDWIFHIFSTICILLSVVSFALMRRLTGEPVVTMITNVLVILLLLVLNVAVVILYELFRQNHK